MRGFFPIGNDQLEGLEQPFQAAPLARQGLGPGPAPAPEAQRSPPAAPREEPKIQPLRRAPTWAEVKNMPEMQSLGFEELEQARTQYFIDVVAPLVPTAELGAAREAFDRDTRPGRLEKAARDLEQTVDRAANIVRRGINAIDEKLTEPRLPPGPEMQPYQRPFMERVQGYMKQGMDSAAADAAARRDMREGADRSQQAGVDVGSTQLGRDLRRGFLGLRNSMAGMELSEMAAYLEGVRKEAERLGVPPEQVTTMAGFPVDYPAAVQSFQRTRDEYQRRQREMEVIPRSAPVKKMFEGEGAEAVDNFVGAFREDPGGATSAIIGSSVPGSLAILATAALTRLGGFNATTTVAAGGVASITVEFGNKYAENREQGMGHNEAWNRAAAHSGVIGLFDAVSLKSAGKAVDELVRATAVKQWLKESGRQAVLGAGGETLGSVAAGEMPHPGEVAAEAVGEFVLGIPEALPAAGGRKPSTVPPQRPEEPPAAPAPAGPAPAAAAPRKRAEGAVASDTGVGDLFTAADQAVPPAPASAATAAPKEETKPLAFARGSATRFATERGAQIEGQFAVVDADALVASHDSALNENPAYPKELQPRDRTRDASELQIARIAQNLQPEFLGGSPQASQGAPIVGEDGIVESGNARTIALRRAYRAGKATSYRDWVLANAERFGIDPRELSQIRNPVLVRIRTTPVNRAEFARQANEASVATLSPLEMARSDAARLKTLEDLQVGESGEIQTGANMPFIRRFVGLLPVTEQGALVTKTGELSQAGAQRLRNAILARAYGGGDVLMRMVESPDDNIRNITSGLVRAAPRVAKAREEIVAGQLHDLDITEDLLRAVESLSRLRADRKSVDQWLAQTSFLDDHSDEFKALLKFLDESARSPRRIAEFIEAYLAAVDQAGSPAQESMFGDAVPTRGSIIEHARKGLSREPEQPELAPATPAERAGRDAAVPRPSQPEAQGGQQPARAERREDRPREAAPVPVAPPRPAETARGGIAPPAAPKPAEPPKAKPARQREELAKALREHFTPGNIIWSGYWRMHDRVVSFDPDGPNGWSVTVERVEKRGDDWVAIERPRQHSTRPDKTDKVVERAAPAKPKRDVELDRAFRERLESMDEEAKLEALQALDVDVDERGRLFSTDRDNNRFYLEGEQLEETKREFLQNTAPAETPPAAEKPAARAVSKAFGDDNKIFTKERAAAARNLLRKKLSQVSSGLDPEMVQAGIELAGFYIEGGARKFADFSAKMIADLGERARPYLKSWYLAVRNYPGFNNEGMESEAQLEQGERDAGTVRGDQERPGEARPAAEKGEDAGGQDLQRDEEAGRAPGDREVRGGEARPEGDQVVDEAAHEAATSPRNDLPAPSEAQKEAGNYQKGHATIAGLEISIENPAGSKRRPEWPTLKQHYGYFKGTVGFDKDHLDVFVKPGTPEDFAGTVFVVNQLKADGKFDEHKVMLGFDTEAAAREAYLENYTAGWESRVRSIVPMPLEALKEWAFDTTKKGPKGGVLEPPAGRTIQAEGAQDEPAAPAPVQDRDGERDRSAGAERGEGRRPLGERLAEADEDAGAAGQAGQRRAGPGEPGSRDLFGSQEGRGEQPSRRPRARADVRPEPEPARVARAPTDYAITDEDRLGEGGAKQKYRDNVAAIRLLKQLEEEERLATPDEQRVLVRYVGWGGLKGAFDPEHKDWTKEHVELKELLSEAEYEAARRTILDAHYTSVPVVRGIYAVLERLGFKRGRVLEPSMGTGNFIGLMPGPMRAQSSVFGVELDELTGRIARQLYQRADIASPRGFQEVTIPVDYFDVAIGNPPFGSQQIFDREHQDISKFSIHNFFFAKSLEKLRPGGVLAMVVSRYFMDAQDPAAREWIAARAKLIGAVRLPETAFKQNAGTEVVTDIVFLQKLEEGEKADAGWTRTGIEKEHGTGAAVNKYFVDNPDMVLGEFALTRGMHRADELTVLPTKGQSIADGLAGLLERFPRDVYRHPAKRVEVLVDTEGLVPEVKVGNYFLLPDGTLARRIGDVMDKRRFEKVEVASPALVARIKGMVEVRDVLRELMRAELTSTDDKGLGALRQRLNSRYDAFVRKQGFINSQANRRAFQDDPDLPLLESLEPNYDPGISREVAKKRGGQPRLARADKATIFTKRVLAPYRLTTHADSAKDALVASLNEHGGVNLPYMAEISGRSEEDVAKELVGLIYREPAGNWVTAEEYLSGNVKAKLVEARAAGLANNVAALERVQPADIPALDISVRLGSAWVPPEDIAAFAEGLVEKRPAVNYIRAVGRWNVRFSDATTGTAFTATWGTRRLGFDDLLTAVLNMQPVVVRDNVGTRDEPEYVVNEPETQAAQAKAEEIAQRFKDWIWQEPARRERLARLYNDTFNTNRRRSYDGSHLQLPGMNPAIKLRPSQKNAIWRIIQDRSALLDHVVGAGKTFTGIGAFMELKRLGLVRKPVFGVPNHLVRQWRDEFYRLYPNANILATTEKDFGRANRQRLFSKIATSDWDAVIVAHSSFKKIGMPAETEQRILGEMLAELTDAIEEIKRERGDRNLVRDMERIKENLEAKMARLNERAGKKDVAVTFDELGVDALFMDEAHAFKNLFYFSQMKGVAGLGNPQGSGRAFDLFVKMQYLDEFLNGQAATVFATGTPVSNSLVEMYTMQRYMMYRELKNRGIHLLDPWAGTFGDVQQVYEVHPSGNGYRLATRFAKFVNMPELMTLYRDFADVITMDDLKRQAEQGGERFPVPKLKGGKPKLVVAERSPQQTEFFGMPQFVRGPDDEIVFEFNEDPGLYSVGQTENSEKWEIRFEGRAVRVGFDSEAEARDALELGLRTPRTKYNEGSILWKFENLKQLVKESDGKINALSITNEARKAGLDYRLIDPEASDFPGSKINLAVDEIVRIYGEWRADRGAQLVFSDLSVPASARAKVRDQAAAQLDKERADDLTATEAKEEEPAEEAAPAEEDEGRISMDQLLATTARHSVYDDIKAKLIGRGIPEAEIAFIHDYDTADKKQKLFQAVREGRVRILIGSTEKMGAGMNVQDRLVAEHHIDAPWRPSDLEQREGRIIRQGNKLYERDPDGFEIEIVRYSTKQTYDTRMWQIIEHKARGVEQLRRADETARVVDDISGEAANAADMKAAASGNPLILDEIKLRNEVRQLEALEYAHQRGVFDLQSREEFLSRAEQRRDAELAGLEPWRKARDATAGKDFAIEVGGKQIAEKKDIGGPMIGRVAEAIKDKRGERHVAGTYRGMMFAFSKAPLSDAVVAWVSLGGDRWSHLADYGRGEDFSPTGFVTRMDNWLDKGIEAEAAGIEDRTKKQRAELAKVRDELKKPFSRKADLDETRKRHREIVRRLQSQGGAIELTAEMREEMNAALARRGISPRTDAPALSRGAAPLGKPTREFGFDGLHEITTQYRVADIEKYSITTPEYRDDDVVATPGARQVRLPVLALVQNPQDPASPIEIVDGWHRVRQALANGDEFIPMKMLFDPDGRREGPALSRQADNIEDYRLEKRQGKVEPLFWNRHIALAAPTLEHGPDALGEEGARLVMYRIFDAQSLGAGKTPVQIGILRVIVNAEDKFTDLRLIELRKEFRRKGLGWGEDVIASLLAHNGTTPMRIIDIQHDTRNPEWHALPFWQRMGTILDNFSNDPDVQIDGTLTRANYLKARRSRGTLGGSREAETEALRSRGEQAPQRRGEAPARGPEPRGEEGDRGGRGGAARGDEEGLGVAAVRRQAEAISKAWSNAPGLVVTDTPSQWSFPAEADARGAYWRGKVYLAGSNLADETDVEFTVFHEALGHYGLRKTFGKELDPILRDLGERNANLRRAAARWLERNAKPEGWTEADYRLQAIEEALADVAGSGRQLSGLGKLLAAVQRWLRAHGFARVADWLETLSDAEALSVLAEARRFVEGARPAAQGPVVPALVRANGKAQYEAHEVPALARRKDRDQGKAASQRDLDFAGAVPRAPEKGSFALRIEPARRGELRIGFPTIDTPEKAAHAFAALRKAPREYFQMLVLDKADKPIAAMHLFAGTLTQTSVYPREVLSSIYQTPGAAKVWFAHNHPSGVATPSQVDEMLTRQINEGLGPDIGVEFAGHVIIAGNKARAMLPEVISSAVSVDWDVIEAIAEKHSMDPRDPEASGEQYVRELLERVGARLTDTEKALIRKEAVKFIGTLKGSGVDIGPVMNIPPAPRRHAIPIMERTITRQSFEDRVALTSPSAARDYLQRFKKEATLVFLDAQHRVIGTYPMEPEEMMPLRTGDTSTGAARLFRLAAATNPAAVIYVAPRRMKPEALAQYVGNLGAALRMMEVKVLDAFALPEDGGTVAYSLAERGMGDAAPAFFSRGRIEPTAPRRSPLQVYRDTVQSALDRVERALEPIRSLPGFQSYMTERYLALGKIARVDEIAAKVRAVFAESTEEDRREAYEYLTTFDGKPDGIKSAGVRATAADLKKLINNVGDRLVERGLLSPDAREAHRDAYLPRLYLRHMLTDADYKALGGGKKPSDMGYLKKRKDIPEEVRRIILGEITDPGYLASVAIGKPLRDMALLDWLDTIAQNKDWVLPGSVVEFKGKRVSAYWLREEAAQLRKQARYYKEGDAATANALAAEMDTAADAALEGMPADRAQYKQIPDTHRYGRLRGLWVRREIYDDLMGVHDFIPADPGWFANIFGYGGIGTKATQLWKMGKVALNPPAQVRNFVSNMVLLQLSGVPLHRIPGLLVRAVQQITGDGKYWRIAKKYGVTESTFVAQELYRFKRELLDLEARAGTLSALGKLHMYAARLADFAGDSYQGMEALGKTMKIMHGLEHEGRDESDAAQEAQKWLFDYSLVSKSVRYARNAPIGVPFLTFQVKVLPRLLETAALHPQRFLPWVALLYGLPMAVAAMFDVDDDDLEKLKQALPDWLRERGHTLLLPWKDERGRWQVFDVGYFFPWAMWSELGANIRKGELSDAVMTAGLLSGPVTDLVVAVKTGKDPFTKRDIWLPNEPPRQQVTSLLNYLWSLAAPPFLTDRGALGHTVRAYTGETNKYGDPRSTLGQAALRLFGVNLYAMHPEQTRAQNARRMQFEIDDMGRNLRMRLQDRSLSKEAREKLIAEYRGEIKRRSVELRDYLKASEIHPNLRTQH